MQMITIEIMYDDLSIVKRPIAQLNTLQKTGIEFILFKKDGANIISLMGFDHYYMKYLNGILQYVQFNDEDGVVYFHDVNQGTTQTDRVFRDTGWIPPGFTHFEGKQLSFDMWSKALTKFANEMQ